MRKLTLAMVMGLLVSLSVSVQASPDTGPQPASKPDAAKVMKDAGVKAPAPTASPKAKLPPPAEPTDPSSAVSAATNAVKAAKAGNWWYFSALVILVLMFLLKWIGHEDRAGYWQKLGRWRYVISPVLSIAAALLAAFQGGVSMEAAMAVFTSSYATSSLQELWEHGIRGKPRKSAGG